MAGGCGWEAAGASTLSLDQLKVSADILFPIFPQPGLCWNIKRSIQLSGWALWGSPSSRVTFPKRGLLFPEGLNEALLQRGVT